MRLYCVTPFLDEELNSPHVQRFQTRPPADSLLDTHRRADRFARLVQWDDGETAVELAHVRNGLLYEGLTSRVDWADLGQVVEVWERAKQAIRDRLHGALTAPEVTAIIGEVVTLRGLPEAWESRLRAALEDESPTGTVISQGLPHVFGSIRGTVSEIGRDAV